MVTRVGSRHNGLSGRYYTDPDVFAHELDHIFARTWQLVGHVSQVASPGQVFTAPVGDESVLVVNHDGAVRGFYNVCQHRGHRLVESDFAELSAITCPYHAWTYDLGGRLVTARGEDVGELCVPPVRLDTMAGFLFANLDPDAFPLEDTIPGIESELLAIAPDAGQRVLSSRRTQLINANWKIAVENYNECYHCPNVHKSFTTNTVNPGSYRIALRGFTIHHTAQGAPPKPSGSTGHGKAGEYGAFYTWPVSSIQCYPGRELNTFRWVPLAVDQTLLIREWWARPGRPHPRTAGGDRIGLDHNRGGGLEHYGVGAEGGGQPRLPARPLDRESQRGGRRPLREHRRPSPTAAAGRAGWPLTTNRLPAVWPTT